MQQSPLAHSITPPGTQEAPLGLFVSPGSVPGIQVGSATHVHDPQVLLELQVLVGLVVEAQLPVSADVEPQPNC